MDRLEFLTEYLHRFNQDTLHLVGIGLGLLGTMVGIWAKLAGIRHKKQTRLETENHNEKMEQQDQKRLTLEKDIRDLKGEENQLKLRDVQLALNQAGRIKMDPQLKYTVHKTAAGTFLVLSVDLTQKGSARVYPVHFEIEVDVLDIDGTDLKLNEKKELRAQFDLGVSDTEPLTGESFPEQDRRAATLTDDFGGFSKSPFWWGLAGFYSFDRSKEVEIPVRTSGTGLFSLKFNLVAHAVEQNHDGENHFSDDMPQVIGGETLVGSIN